MPACGRRRVVEPAAVGGVLQVAHLAALAYAHGPAVLAVRGLAHTERALDHRERVAHVRVAPGDVGADAGTYAATLVALDVDAVDVHGAARLVPAILLDPGLGAGAHAARHAAPEGDLGHAGEVAV